MNSSANMQKEHSNGKEPDQKSVENNPEWHTVDIELRARWPLPPKQPPEKQHRSKSTWQNRTILILLLALALTLFIGQLNEFLSLMRPILDWAASFLPDLP